jgi:hypothetical protein
VTSTKQEAPKSNHKSHYEFVSSEKKFENSLEVSI